jgi:uncharacterized protein (DUF305 family)
VATYPSLDRDKILDRDNAADLRFLEQSLEALDAMVPLSRAAAELGSDDAVRALARRALSSQERFTRTLERLVVPVRRGSDRAPGPLPPPDDLDRSFVTTLEEHARGSLERARVQLVEGLDHDLRRIAEDLVRESHHELAVIAGLAPTLRGRARGPALRDPVRDSVGRPASP